MSSFKSAILLVLGIPTSTHAAQLLTNGDFIPAPGTFVPNEPSGGMKLDVGSTVIPGWTVIAGSVFWERTNTATFGVRYSIRFGDEYGEIRADPYTSTFNGTIFGDFTVQPIKLNANDRRFLLVGQLTDSINALGLPHETGILGATDDENDALIDALDQQFENDEEGGMPVRSSFTFGRTRTDPLSSEANLRSSEPTLHFAGLGVRVSAASLITNSGGTVPEPATWASMIVGFAGLGVAMRSRRKKPVPYRY